jgi:type II secretory ATPase GspE/PulE/Tfp pilus assembly ATPase PilB-like protein
LYQVEVRGLCPHCREKYALNTADQQILNKLFDTSKSSKVKQFHELEKEAAKDNIEAGLPLTSSPGQINQLWRAHSRGCKRCDYTGYVQSVRLFEACRLTNDIKRHLLGAGSVSEIYKSALEDGMINLLSDGLVKALRGQIDLPALMSVATLQ